MGTNIIISVIFVNPFAVYDIRDDIRFDIATVTVTVKMPEITTTSVTLYRNNVR